MNSTRLPDFVGIGAPRSGTTWLWDILRSDQAVFVSEEKEISYFNREAIDFPHLNNPRFDWPVSRYLQAFRDASPSQPAGEISPAYLASRTAAERMSEVVPDAKLVAILRDPVERTISDYRYRQLRGTVRKMSLDEALQSDSSIVERSLYADHLDRFRQHYPPEQVLLLHFGDISEAPDRLLGDLGQFLHVELGSAQAQVTNASGAPRARRLNRLLSTVERRMRQPPLDSVWRAARKTPLRSAVREIRRPRRSASTGETIDPKTIENLSAHFAETIDRLASDYDFHFRSR